MESVWNDDGKIMEKNESDQYEEKWNGIGMGMEWKWNGTFMKKFSNKKWDGNREEMEQKIYGRNLLMQSGMETEWKWKGNGMERKRNQ